MSIAVRCPKCEKKLNAPDSAAGKRAKCPACGQVMQMPAPPSKPPQAEEAFEDLRATDPLGLPPAPKPAAPMRAAAAATPAVATPSAAAGLSGFSAQQFDEMLADVGPSVDVKKNEPKQDRIPCPICHEMIVRGSARCRFCGEDFQKNFESLLPKTRSAPRARGKTYHVLMIVLGIYWILIGVFQFVLLASLLVLADAARNAIPNADRPGILVGFCIGKAVAGLVCLGLGIAACGKQIRAVQVGLGLSYLVLVVSALQLDVCGLVLVVPVLGLAHYAVYLSNK
jgi:phage FluMu protein Com